MTNKEFKYTTAIRKIRNMKARKKIIQGGTSAGKTIAILAILIDSAARTPGLEISVVSESIPHLRRGALKDFLKIMKITGRFIESNYNKTLLKYEFKNGSFIEFFSVDDESKLRGARRNVLYVNEANNIKFDAYNQLAMRTNGDIYIDFNPTNTFWAMDEVANDEDSELVILTYKDNEALDQTTRDMLLDKRKKAKTSEYWKNWCRVYLDGLVGSLEGAVYSNWEIIDEIPEDARLIGYGLDFGYSNDETALAAVYKINDNIVLDEIIYSKRLLNSDISKIIKEKGLKGTIYADSAEPKSIAELRSYGHSVMPAKKGRDSIKFGISILQEYNMLVTRRSKNLLDELGRYLWKKDKTGETLNEPIDDYNHLLDAIRYVALSKLRKSTGKVTIIRR